jgi:ABC-type Na+ efflux pump permease subunit
MKSRRVAALAKKEWKKTVRDPAVLFMIILFPVLFVLAFGSAFGGGGGTTSPTYSVAVVDLSSGANGGYSQQLVSALSATHVLSVQPAPDNATAQSRLSQGQVQAVLVIPQSFDSSVQSYLAAPSSPGSWVNSSIQVYTDKASLSAGQVVPTVVSQVLTSSVLGIEQPKIAAPVAVSSSSLEKSSTSTAFDAMAPGMFSFASIYLIMMVAGSFTGDRENGILRRISTTPTTAGELMTSQASAYLVIGLAQVVLVFGTAYALGFRPVADGAGLFVGFLIATVFALCNVGFGLIAATIAKSQGAATGISFVFLLPQLFLGTFVGASLSPTAQAVGRFVPAYYVTDALTSLFTRGAAATSQAVLFDLFVVSASSVVVLLAGIYLFNRFSRT